MCNTCAKIQNMAYKRKSPKRRTTRRKRIGGFSSQDIQSSVMNLGLPAAAGIVIGNYLEKEIADKKYGKHANYISMGIGIVGMALSKNNMIQATGAGLFAKGTAGVVADLMDGSNSGPKGLPAPSYRRPLIARIPTPQEAELQLNYL
jgi:hypothetical protein